MTKEAQRIAIAEACGWTGIEDRSKSLMMAPGFSVWGYPPVNPLVGHKEQVPRFCDDLNAMHEAEKTLSENELEAYCFELRCSVAEDGCVKLSKSPLGYEIPNLVRANPNQRAEAFLCVKGIGVD